MTHFQKMNQKLVMRYIATCLDCWTPIYVISSTTKRREEQGSWANGGSDLLKSKNFAQLAGPKDSKRSSICSKSCGKISLPIRSTESTVRPTQPQMFFSHPKTQHRSVPTKPPFERLCRFANRFDNCFGARCGRW